MEEGELRSCGSRWRTELLTELFLFSIARRQRPTRRPRGSQHYRFEDFCNVTWVRRRCWRGRLDVWSDTPVVVLLRLSLCALVDEVPVRLQTLLAWRTALRAQCSRISKGIPELFATTFPALAWTIKLIEEEAVWSFLELSIGWNKGLLVQDTCLAEENAKGLRMNEPKCSSSSSAVFLRWNTLLLKHR